MTDAVKKLNDSLASFGLRAVPDVPEQTKANSRDSRRRRKTCGGTRSEGSKRREEKEKEEEKEKATQGRIENAQELRTAPNTLNDSGVEGRDAQIERESAEAAFSAGFDPTPDAIGGVAGGGGGIPQNSLLTPLQMQQLQQLQMQQQLQNQMNTQGSYNLNPYQMQQAQQQGNLFNQQNPMQYGQYDPYAQFQGQQLQPQPQIVQGQYGQQPMLQPGIAPTQSAPTPAASAPAISEPVAVADPCSGLRGKRLRRCRKRNR